MKISSYGALLFAVIAFTLGILLRSQVILFDGMYSIISVLLSFLGLFAFRYMQKSDRKRFPFGKDTLEPLILLTKYFALMALVLASMLSAAISIFQGGRAISVGTGLVYAVAAWVYCLLMHHVLLRAERRLQSNLLRSEVSEWQLDAMVSLGVLVGFLLAFGFTFVPALLPYQSYIDPAMMILVGIYFLKWPVQEIKKALMALLDMRPTDGSGLYVEGVVQDIQRAWGFEEAFIRVARPRQSLWLEVDYVVGHQNLQLSIREQDQIRQDILRRINEQYEGDHWVTVSFTNDRSLAV